MVINGNQKATNVAIDNIVTLNAVLNIVTK